MEVKWKEVKENVDRALVLGEVKWKQVEWKIAGRRFGLCLVSSEVKKYT
jgi:hypothetical protein